MSAYQYYEFSAIDRPLSEKEMDELHRLSTRARITSTSFINDYQYSSLRANPLKMMEKYFDAFLYMANWGTRRLMFRLPKRLFGVKLAAKYCYDERLSLYPTGKNVVLAIETSDEAGGGWVETTEQLQSLLPLREELTAGDLRCLYLAWLRGVETGEIEDDASEPPLPPGLGKLSTPLRNFADFIMLDEDLIAAAAAGDDRPPPGAPSKAEFAAWLAETPTRDKDAWLMRVFTGELPQLRADVVSAFRAAQAAKLPREKSKPSRRSRTAQQLLDAQEPLRRERIAREQKREARQKVRREREAAAARDKRLESLSQRESAAWREAEKLMTAGGPDQYDQAVEMLGDLCALAERNGRVDEAHAKVKEFRRRYYSRTALMRRFKDAGLGGRG